MSRIMRVSFSVLCFALPFAACECGDDLSAIPQPSAQLRAGEQLAPPLEFVQVAFGAVDVGQGVEQTLAIESIGGAPLTIEQVRLASDTNLCPVVGSGFSVLEPTVGFELPPRRGEEARPPGRDIVVAFTPTDGAPACAVLEVISDDEKNPVLRALLTGQGDAPRLCTETPSIDFGEVFLGATAEKTLVLESCGTKPAVISTISGNQWFPPFGVGDGAAGATLVPGERLSLTVTFSPTEERRWSYATNNAGVVTIATSDGSGQGYQVGLEGTGVREPACRLLVVPGAVAFGTVAEGQTSTQQVVLRNSGELDCSLAGVTVRNPSGPFSSTLVDTSVPTTMSPGAVVIIDVTYAPTVAAGADNGFLDISSNDPVAPTLSVPLEGISVEPTPCMLQAAPSAVNFGNRPMGRTSEVAVVFTNVGTEQCSLTKLELTTGAPQFDVVASLFPLTGSPISPGGSMTAQVTYRPNTQGAAAGNLRATYKEGFSFNLPFPLPGGSSDQTLDVPLLGQGVPPALCVSPAALDFGSVAVGASRQEPVQVINCGSTPLEVRGLQLRAATHPDFSIANAPALPLTLDAGAGFPVTVRAAPTQGGISAAGSGMYGALEVLSDDFDDPAVAVPLTANSSGCQGLVCSPQEVDFGEVDVGLSLVRSVTCQNPSSTPVSVNPSTLAPFEVLSGPEVVAPGAVVVLTVRYTPDAAGADGGWLEMGAQACNGTALRVDLQGAGVTNALPECPTPQSFTPEVVWNWQGGSTLPMSRQTWVTPLVSRLQDTTGDGLVTREDMPRVIFSSFDHRDSPGLADFDHINDPVPGVIRAVDGATGVEVFTIIDEEHRVNSSVNLVVADIDADGYVEIVGQRYVLLEGVETIENGPKINGKFVRGNLIAFEHDGTFKWVSEEWTRSESEIEDTGAIAVADIDGDGFGELAVGDHVFDHNGNLLWVGGRGTGSTGHGPASVFVELDGQPGLELLAGETVYRSNGTILWDRSDITELPALIDGDPSSMHAAAADLNGDGRNEVVLRGSELWVLDGRTGATLAGPLVPPTSMSMGRECVASNDPDDDEDCNPIPTHPAIMDIDGLPGLEIAVSNTEVLLVYDRNLNELWRAGIGDYTGASGPVGFDFEADGKTNVTYSDETRVWVYNATGVKIYDAERGSVTMTETVAIADIDNDGHANVLVGSNEPQFGISYGLDALTNTGVSWAHARGMWNQHAYVEDLVGELGALLPPSSQGALQGFRTASAACE